jgi:polyisoprenoid-binding protein YceI
MKKIILALAGVAFMASCAETPSGEAAKTADVQETAVVAGDPYAVGEGSMVSWYGATPTHGHKGGFMVNEGTLFVKDNAITGGNFMIDITSMTNLDADTNGGAKLMGHLMSGDFFDAEKYPSAKFEITAVEPIEGNAEATHNISGNLTMKDSTKNVVIPAMVTMEEGKVMAKSKFTIDRTDWGMVYGNDEGLKDKFIYPKVEMELNITAAK